MIEHFSKSFIGAHPWLKQEFLSAANFGLYKACEKFDYRKDYQLATYASTIILNELRLVLRREGISGASKSKKALADNTTSMDKVIGDDNDSEFSSLVADDVDILGDIVSDSSFGILIDFILNTLKPNELKMFLAHSGAFGTKQTQLEYSKSLGVSQSYANRLYKDLRNSIKKRVARDEHLKEMFNFPDAWLTIKSKNMEKILANLQKKFVAPLIEFDVQILAIDIDSLSIKELVNKYQRTITEINQSVATLLGTCVFEKNGFITSIIAEETLSYIGINTLNSFISKGNVLYTYDNISYVSVRDLWAYLSKMKNQIDMSLIPEDFPYTDTMYIKRARAANRKLLYKKYNLVEVLL